MSARRRQEIRQKLRQRRRDLNVQSRVSASDRLCRQLVSCHFFRSAQHIAAYLPNDGEIDPWPAIAFAWRSARTVYLPVVLEKHRLGFAPFQPDTPLRKNRFGIDEPVVNPQALVSVRRLDLVLMPLVAFDDNAHRIGMGGGYYDRCFGFLRSRAHWLHPRLVGLAYDFQKVDNIAPAPWDVAAWRIITDRAVYPAAKA